MSLNYINRVTLVGTIASTPQFTEFANGGTIATFNLLTRKSYQDKSGTLVTKDYYTRICVRNSKILPQAIPFLKEHNPVLVEGEIETRSWTDETGQKQYITEVSVPPFSGTLINLCQQQQQQPQPNYQNTQQTGNTLNDSIPF